MQTICTSLQTDNNMNTSSLNFYRPNALPDAQPTVSNQWKPKIVNLLYYVKWVATRKLHHWCRSVLWRCWLGGRKGILPVKKTEWWGAGMVICLERGADLHMFQLMPLPLTVSCFSKIQIGVTFLVPAYPGSPGKRAVKWVCVFVCVCVSTFLY